MFKNGQREFVIYEKGKKEIPFDLQGKYKKYKMVVLSNVIKSDFSIKVDCTK